MVRAALPPERLDRYSEIRTGEADERSQRTNDDPIGRSLGYLVDEAKRLLAR